MGLQSFEALGEYCCPPALNRSPPKQLIDGIESQDSRTAEQLINLVAVCVCVCVCLSSGFPICEVGTVWVPDSFLPPGDDLRESEVMSGQGSESLRGSLR